jgi:peptidoglycan/xylan/chitin deacetylase (PgdA/CDA1 family)
MRAISRHPSVPEPWRFRGSRLARSVADALRTRYPRYLVGLAPAADEIPIFHFHDVEADTFARQLEYLRTNGYRTLSLEEFLISKSRKGGPGGRRQVLLTFDDARLSFHRIAFPLLRATRSHATLFAPTLWMGAERPAGAERFMDWEQLRECIASGLVDVASHAHRHALVFDSGRLAGFATPRLLGRYDIYDWPMRHDAAGDSLGRPRLGTPIYSATPLLSARTRYLESAALREACTALVARSGGAQFFSRPDCHARLLSLHRSAAASLHGRFAGEQELAALVASEFESSRAAFEEHLGFAPTVFAYPWTLGSALSLEAARRFGIRCVFGVATDFRRARVISRAGGQMCAYGRIRGDWLELMPGRNRARLLPVLAHKVAARAGQQHLAH